MFIARGLFAAVTLAVAVAAPANAGPGEYLAALVPEYAYLTPQQLIREGAIACSVARSGQPMSDAVPKVQQDLISHGVQGVSVATATDIAVNAAVYLGC